MNHNKKLDCTAYKDSENGMDHNDLQKFLFFG